MAIFNRWDVVIVPFPFTDGPDSKRRPAVVLSPRVFNEHGHTVMAMITSAAQSKWPLDFAFDYHAAGLPKPCVVRMKLFTIDNRLILERIGSLAAGERGALGRQLAELVAGGT